MRNLDFGFNVITRQERDHECRNGTTQDNTVLRHEARRPVTWWASQWESRMTLSHVIWCDSVSTSEPEKLHWSQSSSGHCLSSSKLGYGRTKLNKLK